MRSSALNPSHVRIQWQYSQAFNSISEIILKPINLNTRAQRILPSGGLHTTAAFASQEDF
jgi:hypothetical protein